MAKAQKSDRRERGEALTILAIRAALTRSLAGRSQMLGDPSRGAGLLTLMARRGKGNWYFRYSPATGANFKNWPIGPYDEKDQGGGIGLTTARTRAAELSVLAAKPESRDLHAYFAERQQEGAAVKLAKTRALTAAADEAERKATYTLRKLLTVYCDHLAATGKKSATKVREDLARHVFSDPAADLPAADIVKANITPLVRALVEAHKPRTAGLIRSYIRAAYSLALGADSDAKAPAVLLKFGITGNPAADIKAIPVEKRERALSEIELRALLVRLDGDSSLSADVVRLALIAGGQRPQQVIRLTLEDYNAQRGEVTLWDSKGRRAKARKHVLPLGPMAQDLVARLASRAESIEGNTAGWIFTATGACVMTVSAASHWVTETAKAMVQAREVGASFQMKDLRRTATTHMARMKIGSDVRAQLQSNDLGGMQAGRYDQHDYIDEKRQTLARWERHLSDVRTGAGQMKVIPIRTIKG